MAFVADQDEEQQQQQQQQAGQPQQAGPVLGAPSAAPAQGGGQAPAGASSGKPKQSRSGSFTNLNNYLQANQGNDAQIGTAVRGTVDNQAGRATQALGGMQKEANEQVEKSTVKQNTQVQDAIKNSPTAFDGNDGLTQQFQQQYNASYGGPQNATDVGSYGDTRRSFEKVGNLVGASQGGYQGAQNLVGQTFKNPTYNRGQRSLDSFILGAGQQGQQALKGIKDTYGQFGGNFSSAEKSINDSIGTAKATTDATRDATRLAVDTKDKELGSYFDQIEKDATAKTQAQQDLYTKAVGGDVESLKQLTGLDEATIKSLSAQGYQFDRLAKAGSAYGLGDLADKDQVKNYTALMSLIGKSPARDFTPVGGKDASFDTTQAELAKKLPGMSNSIQAAIGGAKTGQFGALFDVPKGAITPAIKKAQDQALAEMGLTRDDWNWARDNGIDPRKLITEKQLTAGDVAGADMPAYSELANALGITPGFSADKGLGVQRTANRSTIEALKQAASIERDLQKKLASYQAKRDAEFSKERRATWDRMFGKALPSGLDQKQAEELFNQYFTAGRKLNNYDVSSEQQRGQWASLMGALGGQGKMSLNPDSIPEGAAFSFDEAGLRKAISDTMAGKRQTILPKNAKSTKPTGNSWAWAPNEPATAAVPPPTTPTPTNNTSNPEIPWTVGIDPGPLKDKLLQPMATGGSIPRPSDKNTKDDVKDITWSNIRKMVK